MVVDMIRDFVTGKLGFSEAEKVVRRLKPVLEVARRSGPPVIYICDSHRSSDPEIAVWGEHAMEGSEGAKVVEELSPKKGDVVIRKRTYSAFYSTGLESLLRRKMIKEVVLAGVVTDICIQHTAADAFFRNFRVTILEDCTATVDKRTHKNSLERMRRIYGAKIITSKDFVKELGGGC